MFGTREWALRQLQKRNFGVNQQMALSGAAAGIYYTNVAFVFDLLKVRAQFNETKQIKYREEIRAIYNNEGLRGFMKGYQGMFLRDAPGFSFYFFLYELLKRRLGVDEKRIRSGESPKSVNLLLAGGLAGATTWILCYPVDLIKTRLQTAPPGCTKGVFTIVAEIYR